MLLSYAFLRVVLDVIILGYHIIASCFEIRMDDLDPRIIHKISRRNGIHTKCLKTRVDDPKYRQKRNVLPTTKFEGFV